MSLKNTKVKIGKHKSKYKAPKDMEKSLKIPTRKEKYTHDDKDGKMNPYSKGKIQPLVPRKVTMEDIIDDGSLVPKIKERLYKKIQDGEYDPAHAQKVLDKLQKASTKSYLDKRDEIDHGVTTSELKESLRNYKNLSSLQKEELVRSLIRLKIKNQLIETYNIYEAEEEVPADTPAPEEEAAPEGEVPPPPAEEEGGEEGEEEAATGGTATAGAATGATTAASADTAGPTTGTDDQAATDTNQTNQEEPETAQKDPKKVKKDLEKLIQDAPGSEKIVMGLEPLIKALNSSESSNDEDETKQGKRSSKVSTIVQVVKLLKKHLKS